ERQRDDYGLDIRILEHLRIVALNLDLFLGCLFIGVAILRDQAGSRGGGGVASPVAVERAMNVIWPDVADRNDLHIVAIDRADQNASFIAGADHRDAKRIANRSVAEILAAGRQAGGGANAEDALQKVAAFELLGRRRLIEGP